MGKNPGSARQIYGSIYNSTKDLKQAYTIEYPIPEITYLVKICDLVLSTTSVFQVSL
jgi:hypothetical protein